MDEPLRSLLQAEITNCHYSNWIILRVCVYGPAIRV